MFTNEISKNEYNMTGTTFDKMENSMPSTVVTDDDRRVISIWDDLSTTIHCYHRQRRIFHRHHHFRLTKVV